MLVKFLSLIASFLMLFEFLFPAQVQKKESPEVLKEPQPEYNANRSFDKIEGADGAVFYIERPAGELNEISVSAFGMSPERKDNFQELKAALNYCKNHPNTKLRFESGTYYLDS